MSFATIIEKYRTLSFNKRDQGDKFERLMKAFLLTYPVFNGDNIQDVWLWKDFPSRTDFGTGVDLGIDLVVRTNIGEYWAVQCKCYSKESHVSKANVDTFLSTSAKHFNDVVEYGKQEGFSRRLWIDTTIKGFSSNAEDTIKGQNPPVLRIGYKELSEAPIDWDKLDAGLFGKDAVLQKYGIRPHQEKAISSVHEHFKTANRGKLIMACGTGKTFTALKIAEKETEDKENPFILFLAPSIALVNQTLKEWCAQSSKPIHGICICSDPKVSQKTGEEDELGTSVIDLALPASTSYDEIEKQLYYARRLQKKDGGMIVVFSTYQSIEVISQVQKRINEDSCFDLCICDEAHRTTGVTRKGEESSSFVKVHDDDFLKTKKRLYMTATPRLYEDSSKKKAEEKEAVVWSMDDIATYGEEFYRIGFGEAVNLGLLSDYKVLVLTLNEEEMPSSLQKSIATASNTLGEEIPTDDSLKLIGCINALSKITKDSESLQAVDPSLMHNAIAFCQSIKVSKKTVKMLDICRNAYYETLTEEERAKLVDVEAQHVDGTMGTAERSVLLSWLKNVDRNSSKCNVLMNVRCLSEGVDVPSLDAVLFLSARNSQVDVVQSVGRVMRKASGKKYGYIIIPVVIPAGTKPEDALDDNKRFQVVWDVLQALRAHDERFNAMVNKIELNKKKPDKVLVGGVATIKDQDGSSKPDDKLTTAFEEKQLLLNFEEFRGAIFAKMVQKVGSKRYWEQWAKDIADIAERHITQINKIIHEEGSKSQKVFDRYLKGLRKNINPSVTEQDAVEMLAQHFITKPVFEALFENYSFAQNNAISKGLSGMVSILNEQTPKEDNEKLERFYNSVKERAKGIDNAESKQKIIIELYDKFFKTAFPKTVEKLGIVYTPVEVVDFIINSVEDVLKKEFGRSISDENVHVLDPFTGTGTFIVRLLQSGIIKPEDMGRKYRNELHACEIVLLAYYIASINIENSYHDFVQEHKQEIQEYEDEQFWKEERLAANRPFSYKEIEYESFDGIVLTDTFQMTEDNSALIEDVFPQNSTRVNKLKKTPLTVILGNPPYSVGQKSANDNAQNQHYTLLERSVDINYAKDSSATNKNSIYDSYIKAFRWATDRFTILNSVGEKIGERDGIIGFVTNAGWLTGNAMDGMRKCFEKEFAEIYVFNLRGDCRTSGELRRKEGGNIFGLGSRTPIAVTILVKKANFTGKAKIHYKEVDDYLKREEKLELCKNFGSVLSPSFKSKILTPNEHGDWIVKRNDKFKDFIELGNKEQKNKTFFCQWYSNGLKTGRDDWIYGFSEEKLEEKVNEQITFYNSELKRFEESDCYKNIDDFIKKDLHKFSWDRETKNRLLRKISFTFDKKSLRDASYRPFVKRNVYFSSNLNQRTYQIKKLFPQRDLENLVIALPGLGNKKPFSVLISNLIPDLGFNSASQCFPLYWYKETTKDQGDLFYTGESEYQRNDGITDFILERAREKYGPRVMKEDIFYYVYGILHSKSYAQKFADDLKMSLPRLPLVTEPQKFWAFSKAGRELAELHLNYEDVPACPNVVVKGDNGNYLVDKMRYPSKEQKDTIIYNNDITISNIPSKAYEYVVNGKSAIEWIMERYAITTNKDSGIKNDPNDWAKEHNKPRYILDLLLSVINVSVQTVDIVNSLPAVDWDKE